jgi:[CysO sulfur-carrier protein]-S-L-cysteine hydrolase
LSTPFRLSVPRYFHGEIVSQAQTELPNECCGLLAGRIETNDSGPVGRVTRRFPLVNAAASARRFDSEPRSMFEAHKALRCDGLEILAIYHSHPTSAPIPSATDLERSYSPGVVNLIVSLEGGVVELRGWWFDANGYVEAEVEWIED